MLNTTIRVTNCFHKNEITFKYNFFDNTKAMFINTLCSPRTYTKHTFRETAATSAVDKYRICGTCAYVRACVLCVCVTRYRHVSDIQLWLISDALFQAGPPTFSLHQIQSGSRAHSPSHLTSKQSVSKEIKRLEGEATH